MISTGLQWKLVKYLIIQDIIIRTDFHYLLSWIYCCMTMGLNWHWLFNHILFLEHKRSLQDYLAHCPAFKQGWSYLNMHVSFNQFFIMPNGRCPIFALPNRLSPRILQDITSIFLSILNTLLLSCHQQPLGKSGCNPICRSLSKLKIFC